MLHIVDSDSLRFVYEKMLYLYRDYSGRTFTRIALCACKNFVQKRKKIQFVYISADDRKVHTVLWWVWMLCIRIRVYKKWNEKTNTVAQLQWKTKLLSNIHL